MRLAVFDCDGTLSDGQGAVCGAMAQAFGACGLVAPPSHEIRRIVGLSLPVAVRRLTPDSEAEQVDRLVAAYKEAFFLARTEGRVAEPLFDGVPGLLQTLHSQGWQLGVATGKSDRGLTGLLALHGLENLFATLQTADRHPSKPHPSMLEAAMAEADALPAATVMIGDTTFDIEMARAAGVRALGVAWGYHAPTELIAAGAEDVARDAAHLEEMLHG
ncbi:HAD-IA family hydrolase [Altererythrobacter salegens]|uniref:HAD-IA family hydrolase n=1 Tax=Croceibacterium salegens TaxID=1737568 RepID=A0A6I4ST81_9SPHN|nr:HAD-IA family hydrolase [Croceibacterium salegens]